MWYAWQQEWLLYEKVDFDGPNKIIYVHPEVTVLDIRTDLYSAWVRWVPLQSNSVFLPAMKYSGLDPIPGGVTGDSYFLYNGWKLYVDITKVKVTGVLFSENYDTAYFSKEGTAVYPAQVSALVNTVAPVVNIDGLSVPTAVEIRQEIDTNSVKLQQIKVTTDTIPGIASNVRTELSLEISAILSIQTKVDLATAILKNKTVTNPTTGVMTVYAADGTTPLLTAQLYEDIAQTQTYRGQGAEVRGALT